MPRPASRPGVWPAERKLKMRGGACAPLPTPGASDCGSWRLPPGFPFASPRPPSLPDAHISCRPVCGASAGLALFPLPRLLLSSPPPLAGEAGWGPLGVTGGCRGFARRRAERGERYVWRRWRRRFRAEAAPHPPSPGGRGSSGARGSLALRMGAGRPPLSRGQAVGGGHGAEKPVARRYETQNYPYFP